MESIKLLDCTLRDGGFVNDWEFGYDNIVNIFERLVNANIDIIELGFLDDRREFDINRTITPSTSNLKDIFKGLDKQNSMLVAMIDYGTCSIEQIEKADKSILDGIRVIFKKNDSKEAICFCKEIKDKGYKVFVQPVSITSYSDQEMLDLVSKVNELNPYSMSIVDTYGLLHKNNLIHYFDLINANLSETIGIGYHSHNNFQLAYANSLELLARENKRDLIIDGSTYGMGKGAGNANTELLAMYLNDNYGKKYDISQILEIIDGAIMKIYIKKQWGYSLRYFLAASNDCHPMYVQYLTQKQTLSVKSINEILSQINDEEKLSFNREYIEKLYLYFQDNNIPDEKTVSVLSKELNDENILVLGPGRSLEYERNTINEVIMKKKPIILAININPKDFTVDYIFLSNAKRYTRLASLLNLNNSKAKIIATSNVTKINGWFDYTVDYSKLVDMNFHIIDNSLLMLLRLLVKMNIKNVSLAGFDGYRLNHAKNYLDMAMEYTFTNEEANVLNEYTISSIKALEKDINIEFITKSYYNGDTLICQ